MEGRKRSRMGREEGKKEGQGGSIREERETGIINNRTRNKHVRNRVLRVVTISARRNRADRNVVLMTHATRGG